MLDLTLSITLVCTLFLLFRTLLPPGESGGGQVGLSESPSLPIHSLLFSLHPPGPAVPGVRSLALRVERKTGQRPFRSTRACLLVHERLPSLPDLEILLVRRVDGVDCWLLRLVVDGRQAGRRAGFLFVGTEGKGAGNLNRGLWPRGEENAGRTVGEKGTRNRQDILMLCKVVSCITMNLNHMRILSLSNNAIRYPKPPPGRVGGCVVPHEYCKWTKTGLNARLEVPGSTSV
jgi:hypothetical protein